MKKESSGAGATFMKTKNSGAEAGAMFMKRAPETELCHFCDDTGTLKNPHCSRAHRRFKSKNLTDRLNALATTSNDYIVN